MTQALPLPPTEPTGRPASAPILQSSILIVDDQQAHVHLLERLLEDAGYQHVTSTTDPQQVRALHAAQPFDLILLDLQMPGMDGFAVMDGLHEDLGSDVLPVIVLTAQPAHKLRALQAGARDFINKPFEVVEVELRIQHMLELHLLHKQLAAHNHNLEQLVRARTQALEESEARYRSLTELAADWYWEQNEAGTFTQVSGPVQELFVRPEVADPGSNRWDAAERQTLQDNIRARRTFLDLLVHCRRPDGSQQQFRVSGEPVFDQSCRFIGYRGLGVEDRSYR